MAYVLFYLILFLLAFVNLLVFLVFNSRQHNFFYGLFLMIAVIANGGYLFIALSNSLGEAVMATRISYVGAAFLPGVALFCVLELCGIDIHWYGRAIVAIWAAAVYGFAMNIGYSDRFYHSLQLIREDGASRLGYQTGPLFAIMVVQIYTMLSLILIVCIYSFREKQSVSYKNMIYLLLVSLVAALGYSVGKVLFTTINIVPLAFMIDGWILLALQRRVILYDVNGIVADTIVAQESYGYIVLDLRKNYIASDHAAQKFFPQIEPLHVDFSLPKDDPFFVRLFKLMDELDDTLNEAVGYVEQNGREYKVAVDYLKNKKGHHLGYYVELVDATDERENERQMVSYNEKLRRDVERETKHLKEVQDRMLLGMANMIENRDNSTGGHIKRTSMGVKILAKELMSRDEWDGVFTAKYCETMIKAAPLHDIGKIAVDDDILKKPGRFTPGEFEQMKQHAAEGAKLLHSVIGEIEDPYFVQIAENMAHYHHERWNGTGYPDKLVGEQIPMEARVMAIADVYDALVSKRCYKDPMTFAEADAIIKEGMGTQFDPALEDVFEACRPRLERYYNKQLLLADQAV